MSCSVPGVRWDSCNYSPQTEPLICHSKARKSQTQLWAIGSGWACLSRGRLDDALQRSLLPSTLLWACSSEPFSYSLLEFPPDSSVSFMYMLQSLQQVTVGRKTMNTENCRCCNKVMCSQFYTMEECLLWNAECRLLRWKELRWEHETFCRLSRLQLYIENPAAIRVNFASD